MSTVANALIVGVSGGIGSAFATELRKRHPGVHLIGTSRDGSANLDACDRVLPLDYGEPQSIGNCAAALDAPLDLVIVATGLLHEGDVAPEKSLRDLDADRLARVFAVNTIGPALVMQHVLPKMVKDRRSVFAALSARVGSISDNHIGGWYGYRSAKAALNQMIKTASIEHRRRWPDGLVVGLHPGTVDTELSKPFQGNVPDDKLFSAEFSATSMLDVLDDLGPEDSGRIFDWAGKEVQP